MDKENIDVNGEHRNRKASTFKKCMHLLAIGISKSMTIAYPLRRVLEDNHIKDGDTIQSVKKLKSLKSDILSLPVAVAVV